MKGLLTNTSIGILLFLGILLMSSILFGWIAKEEKK